MTKKERAAQIQKIFDDVYKDAECTLNFKTPHELLVAVRLSAQCTDARVNIVTKDLFARYKSPAEFAAADVCELEGLIRSCGFYKNKAKSIISFSKDIAERFGGEVPSTMEELTSLAGVGRKTANLILGDVFGKSAVVVDTHCIRLSNRLGLVNDKDPVKIEFALKKILDPSSSSRFCHQLVYHGRAVCTARSPKCGECPVSGFCKFYGAAK